eukprot:CAMPEP_0168516472 /NCGR_PEP_ID=MMETSP0405-20121227/5422_1 /TAXON_ID=498012 /ORGANISM="Trichosphaerium sp, Strain Am-I-7 wt" /LENGTH=228 /DNA_ID=CAMNT_0008536189 /DNA_START=35 /DNA_END=718 /DNA_ORIENTATION=-
MTEAGYGANNVVKLNVGGTRFETSQSTLQSHGENFLTLLLQNAQSGRVPVFQDKDGYIFIDRSGRKFEAILEYLRTDVVEVPPGVTYYQLLREFDFYQINVNQHANNASNDTTIAEARAFNPDAARSFYWNSLPVVQAKTWLDNHWPRMYALLKTQLQLGYTYMSYVDFNELQIFQQPYPEGVDRDAFHVALARWVKRLYGLKFDRRQAKWQRGYENMISLDLGFDVL